MNRNLIESSQARRRMVHKAFAFVLAITASLSQARADGWISIGPPASPDARALLVSNGVIYAGTSGGGLLTSSDGGRTWLSASIAASSVFAIIQAPTLVLAGTDRGLFSSSAPGTVWQLRGEALAMRSVYSIAVLGATWFAGTDAGLFRTNDQGATWVMAGDVPTVSILALAVTGTTSVFAGSQQGVFASTDSGNSWSSRNTGLTNFTVDAFLASSGSESTLYAAATYTGQVAPGPVPPSGGVFRSTDAGLSWIPIDEGLERPGVGPPPALALAIDSTQKLYVGTLGAGVFQSSDGGQTWLSTSDGLSDLQVRALAIASTSVYAGTTSRGVFLLNGSAAGTLTGIIPVVISSPGAHSAFFRTTLQLTNGAVKCTLPCSPAVPIVGQIVFHPQGVATPVDPLLAFTLDAGQTIMLSEVVSELGSSGIGTLDIVAPPSNIPVAVAQVFQAQGAIGSSGTFGFTEQSLGLADALRAGEAGLLVTPPTVDARLNIGVRTFADGVSVQITVRDLMGNVRNTFSRQYPSDYMAQVTAADFLTTTGVPYVLTPNDSVRIDVLAGTAIFYGVAADNTTNDPSFQLARKIQSGS